LLALSNAATPRSPPRVTYSQLPSLPYRGVLQRLRPWATRRSTATPWPNSSPPRYSRLHLHRRPACRSLPFLRDFHRRLSPIHRPGGPRPLFNFARGWKSPCIFPDRHQPLTISATASPPSASQLHFHFVTSRLRLQFRTQRFFQLAGRRLGSMLSPKTSTTIDIYTNTLDSPRAKMLPPGRP